MGEARSRRDFEKAAANYKRARHRVRELREKPVHYSNEDRELLNLENDIHIVERTLAVIEDGYGSQARNLICSLYIEHKTQEETAQSLHLTTRQVRYRAKKILDETLGDKRQSKNCRMEMVYLSPKASEMTAVGQN